MSLSTILLIACGLLLAAAAVLLYSLRHVINSDALWTVVAERQRQVAREGWTERHDDEHVNGQLGAAAACYALPPKVRGMLIPSGGGAYKCTLWDYVWPWGSQWWKPSQSDRMRDLAKAGALILAEMEREQRARRRAMFVSRSCRR